MDVEDFSESFEKKINPGLKHPKMFKDLDYGNLYM